MTEPLEERLERRGRKQHFRLLFGFEAEQKFHCSWDRVEMETGHIDFAESNHQVEVSPRFYFKKITTGERSENRTRGESANPIEPIVHETNSPTEYITVHYQTGNYKWFEYNFRVRNGVAYLGGRTRLDNPSNGHGWIPPEVIDAIHDHHDVEIRAHEPPWWT